MKHLKSLYSLILLTLLTMLSCQEDDPSLGPIISPTNLQVSYELVGQDIDNPYGDGSGSVIFTATADNAITYKFISSSGSPVVPSGMTTINFTSEEPGVYIYQVTVVAYGTGGSSTSTSVEVEVFVEYTPPPELIEKLVGDGSKTWRIKSESQNHFGLGPVGGTIPCEWYGAGPEEKVGTGMYNDRYIFNIDRTFTHITDNTNDDPDEDTNGVVFGRGGLIEELAGSGGEVQGGDIINYPYSDYTENWTITPESGETIALTGKAFMGYYTGGSHKYQIFDRSVPNELLLKTTDGNGEFDWWFVITSEEPGADNGFNTNYTNLVWSDEFDTNGAPDAANWTYDLGAGGWGNQEEQTYTSDAANVIVEDGMLKITAINTGSGYTSARIKTQGLFDFTYGRVEARAKLPASEGTWPAIWALGSNFETVGWPDCGEIDIMEHAGNNLNTIHGTLHYPGSSGGNADGGTTTVDTATTDFHLYTVEWSPDEILFVVDDTVVYHTFTNNNTTPFNNDFFLIINMAMGGTFGGTIDPAFTQETLEVDYIRVFQ